jgi:hypothetical protein
VTSNRLLWHLGSCVRFGILPLGLLLFAWVDSARSGEFSGISYMENPTRPSPAAQLNLDDSTNAKIVDDYKRLPLHFEPNMGQTVDQVDFVSRGLGYSLFLMNGEAVLALTRPSTNEVETALSDVIRIQLLGVNASAVVRGAGQLAGKSNYLLGNDHARWHTNVPHYGKVEYDEVYPGIDLVYYGTEQRLLEHDFVVSPGADPDLMRFVVEGAESLTLDESGNLIATTKGGDVILQAPVSYQDIDGERISVQSCYSLVDKTVRFQLASYDAAHPVVIDPVLSYATYLGGSEDDVAHDIAVDGSGNVFMTGPTQSANFPTQIPFDATPGGGLFDVFVSAFDSSGSGLIYSTYLGGSLDDRSTGIALDGSGNAFVTGTTTSTNFPTKSPYDDTNGGGFDLFVSVLNSTGSDLIYSTYLGGQSNDSGSDIALDSSGNAFVTGWTSSSDFPLKNEYQGTYGGGTKDAIVSVFNSTGSDLIYSTYLGGNTLDAGAGIVLDDSGNAYVTGNTSSTDFPLKDAFQPNHGGLDDAFVSVFNSAGSNLIYSTYLGGTGEDHGTTLRWTAPEMPL